MNSELVSSLKQVRQIRRTVDALASRGDEGRGMTAISLGKLSSKPSRGFPNEATHPDKIGIPPVEHIDWVEVSGGTETS